MIRNKIKELFWKTKLWWIWKRSKGDYGQFFSDIGHDVACGLLPKDVLKDEKRSNYPL